MSRILDNTQLPDELYEECVAFVQGEIRNPALKRMLITNSRYGYKELDARSDVCKLMVYPMVVRFLCDKLNAGLQTDGKVRIFLENSSNIVTQGTTS